MNKKISLSMIVKNEEKFLKRCLNSVKDIVDEIIIVDTGSSDKTKEIAASMGAKVYNYIWKNDFADARNYSLDKATGDWILILDADEYFEKEQAIKLKEKIKKTNYQALNLQIKNLIDDKNIGSVHSVIRVFKKNPGVKWENSIHEAIFINGKNITAEDTNISIMHSGYISSVVKDKDKGERNKSLIKKELEKNPNGVALNYYMGNEYINENPKKSLPYYEKALKYNQDKNFKPNILSYYLRALFNTNNFEECLKLIFENKKVYMDFTDLYYIEGLIYEKLGRSNDAKELYQKCINLGKPNNKYVSVEGIGDILPSERLIAISVAKREWNLVLPLFYKIIEIDKFHDNVSYFFHLTNRMYGYEETIKLIEQLYNNNNEKELITKYKITLQQRIPNLLPTLHKKLNAEAIFSGEFFNLYLTKQYKETKELLLKQVEKTEQWYVFALLLFDKFSDKDLELELEKNNESSVLLKHMKNELNQNIQINNNNIYLELIDEVIKLKEYELFDKISSIKHIFGNGANKQIAIKLTEYFHDEAAIKFFEEYLKKENEQSIHLKVAELYYGLGKYNLAIQYAEKSFTEDNFRPYEIILESALKLGEKDLVKGLVDSLLPYLPESNFLNSLKDIK